MARKEPQRKEKKKPRMAGRGKRYRCAVCKKRSAQWVVIPYMCDNCKAELFVEQS